MTSRQGLLLHVCAADADRAWVDGYLLPSLGLKPGQVHTRGDDRPGGPKHLEIAEAMARCRYTLLVLSRAFLSDAWNDHAASLASHLAVTEHRLLLVCREPCELPLHLDFRVRLDCFDGEPWDEAMTRLRDLLGQPEPAADELACPYPGMAPYSAEQRALFFGRDAEVEELYRRLRKPAGHMFVVGPSGSGKSSLLRAGLLPRVERDARQGHGARFLVRRVRPGQAPMAALAQALGQAEGQRLDEAVAALLGGEAAEHRVLLVVDPLEEIFTLADGDEAQRFLAALKALRGEPRCSLVATMRADFYPQLMSSRLWPVRPEQRLELGPLRDDALREAICRPAEARGVHVEPRLLERLAHEAGQGVGVLPLLQETLVLLWERRHARGERRLLTLASYEALRRPRDGGSGKGSGLEVALARHADAVLAALPEGGEPIARRIFVRLVRLGEGGPDTPRQQPEGALRAAGEGAALFDAVLRHLAEGRLVTLGGAEGQSGRRVDLAHAALIAGWPALTGWLRELREGEQRRRQLEAKVHDWERLGRGPAGLLDTQELHEFGAWLGADVARELGLDPAMVELFASSHAARSRRARRLAQEQQAARKGFASVLSAAKDVTRLERELRPIAGAFAVRQRLLALSRKLLDDLERLAGARDDASRARALTLHQQADLLREQGKLDEATALHRQAHEYFVRQAERDPSDAQWQRDLALSYEWLGDLYAETGRVDDALGAFQHRVTIFQKLVGADPYSFQRRRDLSACHKRLGDAYARAGRVDDALGAFRSGLAVCKALAEHDPTKAEWQHDLDDAYARLGDLCLATGQVDEALGALRSSVAVRQALAERGPADVERWRELSGAHNKLGKAYVRAGRLGDALGAFRSTLAIRRALVESGHACAQWRKELLLAHGRLAAVYDALGRRDDAEAHYDATSELLSALDREGLSRDDAQMSQIRAWLAAQRSPLEPAPTSSGPVPVADAFRPPLIRGRRANAPPWPPRAPGSAPLQRSFSPGGARKRAAGQAR
ncbi:MAG TPA: toll/interleukin-1 receptor domain-containing protein [Polyangiaceae bacterium]|nr:toll/interleukin-1 receptor domain-containing protein [Polyangiaceae bacterium]